MVILHSGANENRGFDESDFNKPQGTADESHKSYHTCMLNTLSPFVSWHVLEWLSFAHEI